VAQARAAAECQDHSSRPHKLPWKATDEERAIVCALRRATGFPLDDLTWMIQTGLWLPRAERMRQWSSQWSFHVLIPPQNDDPVAQKLRENHNCSALFM